MKTFYRVFRSGIVRSILYTFTIFTLALLIIGPMGSVRAGSDGTVMGRVTEPDGSTGVANAQVTLRWSNWGYSQYQTTSSNGSFTFWNVPAGDYLLDVWANHATYFNPDPQSLTVTADQTNNLGSVKLLNANFFCKVTQPDGVTPATSGSVTVRTNNWSTSKYANIDASGNCKTALSTNGDYVVETWTSHDSYSRPDMKKITYSGSNVYLDGTNGSAVIKMNTPLLRGQIKLPNGTGAQYANINVTTSDDRYVQWASTDSNGNFKIDDFFIDPNTLTPDTEDTKTTGTYTIKITPPYDPPGLSSPAPLAVTLTKGTTNTTYQTTPIVLTESVKTISGTVKRSNGAGVSDASVYAWKQGNGWGSAWKDANSDGSYSFKVSECGTWQVSSYPRWISGVSPDWTYNKAPQTVAFACDNTAETKTVDFSVVTFSATLKGNVYLPNGSTVPEGQYWSVSAWTQQGYGAGNWSQVSGGAYSMKLPPGTYTVSAYGPSNDYGTPQNTVSLEENQIVTLNIKFLEKNSTIVAAVKDNKGNAVANQWCSAWMKNGSGWASGTTNSSGLATMNVNAGTWMVSCYPSGNASASSLSSILSTSTSYVATDPPQEATVTANSSNTVNIVFAVADATLKGTIAKSDGTTIDNMWGWVTAQKCTQTTSSSSFYYSGLGGSISSGAFTLRVPSGCWKLGASLPYGADYSSTTTSTKEVTPTAGETVSDIKLTVVQNNSTIKGAFKDKDGNVLTGIYGSVTATNGVAWQWSSLNNGEYTLKASADKWNISCWVDYSTAQQYYMNGVCEREVTIGANETSTQDFVLQKADSKITIKAVDPNGNPLANVAIKATTQYGDAKTVSYGSYGWWFDRPTNTDQNGLATVWVPAGTYVVSATLAPELGYMNPEPEAVTTSADSPAAVTMKFRKPDGFITGTITNEDGSAHTSGGAVTGFTTGGAYSEAEIKSDGTYSMPIITEESTWYVEAASDISATLGTTSAERPVTVEEDGTTTVNLSLTEESAMPAGSTASFSTNAQQDVVLSDGVTKATFPANSLSTQNISVNVSVTPTVEEAPNTATDAQVGKVAYDVVATQASGNNAGQPITDLASTATITLPYDEQQVKDLGVSESALTVKSWNASTGTYDAVEGAIVDEKANTVTATTNHLTKYVITTVPVEKTKPLPTPPGTPGTPETPGSPGDSKEPAKIITPEVKQLRNRQVAAIRTADGVATVLLYNQDGTLAKRIRPYGSKQGQSFGMTIAEVTGDKQEEIIVWEGSGTNLPVRVLSTDGKLIGSMNTAKGMRAVVNVTDSNADHVAEVLLTSPDTTVATVYTYQNSKMKKLLAWQYPEGSAGASDVVIGNVAGSNGHEVVIRHAGHKSLLTVHRVSVSKKKVARVATSTNSALLASTVLAADVTGDAREELVFNGTEAINIASVVGKGLKTLGSAKLKSPVTVSTGDLTGDEKADVVLVRSEPFSIRVLTYAKNKLQQKGTTVYPFGRGEAKAGRLVIGDFNADGTKEFVVSQARGSKLKAFSFVKGKLKLKTTLVVGTKKTKNDSHSIIATDLNADGKPEILAYSPSTVSITKYTKAERLTLDRRISVGAQVGEVMAASQRK